MPRHHHYICTIYVGLIPVRTSMLYLQTAMPLAVSTFPRKRGQTAAREVVYEKDTIYALIGPIVTPASPV